MGKTNRGLLWDPNGGAAVGQKREVGAAPQGGRCGPVEGKGRSPMGPMGLYWLGLGPCGRERTQTDIQHEHVGRAAVGQRREVGGADWGR